MKGSGDLLTQRESWAQYVQRITRGRPQKDIAQAAGIDPSGLSRWLRSNQTRPRAESVVQFARGLGQPPVEALIAAGYLEAHEVEGVIEVMFSSAALSDDELVDEMRARLAERPQGSGVVLAPSGDLG